MRDYRVHRRHPMCCHATPIPLHAARRTVQGEQQLVEQLRPPREEASYSSEDVTYIAGKQHPPMFIIKIMIQAVSESSGV